VTAGACRSCAGECTYGDSISASSKRKRFAGMFGRILKGQYDVSEMLLVELIYYTREIERTSLRFQFFHGNVPRRTGNNRAVSYGRRFVPSEHSPVERGNGLTEALCQFQHCR
jgi:hypothetical protein